MKVNKHILLYEAFSAKSISKTIDFIGKKVNDKHAKSTFLDYLRTISNRFDLPFDNIDDSYFEYLGKKDAVLVRNKTEVNNPDGIFCLKFWFSIDKGFIGYTYTGNVIEEEKMSSGQSLDKDELRHLNITTGKVQTLKKLSDIKTGDIVVGYFSDDFDTDRLGRATVFVDRNEKVFAIQDFADGSTPAADESDWNKYGKYAWSIGNRLTIDDRGSIADDNNKLSLYIDDGSDLTVDGVPTDNQKEKKLDPMWYNLPMYGKTPRRWGRSSDSIGTDDLKGVDFAIIFYYDEFTKSQVKRPSEKRSYRKETKKGAVALMSQDEIRHANIERYTLAICNSFGLSETEITPRNLQKIVAKMLNGQGSLYNLMNNDIPDQIYRLYKQLISFSEDYESYKSRGNDMTESMKDRLRSRYADVTKRIKDIYMDTQIQRQIKSFEDIRKKLESKDMTELYNKISSLAMCISSRISEMKIDSIDDLIQIRYRLRAIVNILHDDHIGLKSSLRYYIDNCYWPSDAIEYLRDMSRTPELKAKYLIEVEKIERHIKSIL